LPVWGGWGAKKRVIEKGKGKSIEDPSFNTCTEEMKKKGGSVNNYESVKKNSARREG